MFRLSVFVWALQCASPLETCSESCFQISMDHREEEQMESKKQTFKARMLGPSISDAADPPKRLKTRTEPAIEAHEALKDADGICKICDHGTVLMI